MEEPVIVNDEDPADKIDRSQRRYRLSDKGKEAQKKYRESEDGKAAQKRYQDSERGKDAHKRYRLSDKGEETRTKSSNLTREARKIASIVEERIEAGVCIVCGKEDHATDDHPI